MTESILNCQNLPSPEPLRMVRVFLRSGPPQDFSVLLDHNSVDDVSNFLNSQGYSAKAQKSGKSWRLDVAPEIQQQQRNHPFEKDKNSQRTVVVLCSNALCCDELSLGKTLMHKFVQSLPTLGSDLWRMLLFSDGVRLAVYGSKVLNTLRELEMARVRILVCRTSLDHYGLAPALGVGFACGMQDMLHSMQLADSIIKM